MKAFTDENGIRWEPGRCFEYAAKRMGYEPADTSARVVHGLQVHTGFIHAWFEHEGLAWDYQTHGRAGSRARFKVTSTTPPGIPIETFLVNHIPLVAFDRLETARRLVEGGWYESWIPDDVLRQAQTALYFQSSPA